MNYQLNTLYILPLLKLNFNSYGEGNFITSYITRNYEVVVRVKDKERAGMYYKHAAYKLDFTQGNLFGDADTYIVYEVPTMHHEDVDKFVEGKYSEMSMFAKDAIKQHSGLTYNKPSGQYEVVDGKKVELKFNSPYILALDKDATFRSNREQELDVKISESAELIDRVKDSEFIEL